MVEKQTLQPLKENPSLFLPSFKKESLRITTGFIGLLGSKNQEIEDVIPS